MIDTNWVGKGYTVLKAHVGYAMAAVEVGESPTPSWETSRIDSGKPPRLADNCATWETELRGLAHRKEERRKEIQGKPPEIQSVEDHVHRITGFHGLGNSSAPAAVEVPYPFSDVPCQGSLPRYTLIPGQSPHHGPFCICQPDQRRGGNRVCQWHLFHHPEASSQLPVSEPPVLSLARASSGELHLSCA